MILIPLPLPPPSPTSQELLNQGLFTMMRGHSIFTNPPLVITEDELREGFGMLDRALHVLDDAMED